MYFARAGAARQRRVKVGDFRLGESSNVPADVALPNRNYMNLFEMPVRVALRAAHSLVHLTYNNVIHRLAAFAASNVVLLLLWARLVVSL